MIRISLLTKSSLLVSLVVIGAMIAAPAFASVPVSITQQGKLLDQEGEPMTGERTLQFAIYDAPSGGDLLWSDEVSVDLGDTGVYTATLGGTENPIDAMLLQDGRAYMELTVGSNALEPRLEMTSVPFAALSQRAMVAESVVDGSITSEALAPGAVTSEAVDSIDWEQISGVPESVAEPEDTLANLSCGQEEVAIYVDDGWTCGSLPSYSGEDFALADQVCAGDQIAVGINADGTLACDDRVEYTGADFAVSDQDCSGDQVVVGVSSNGSLICGDQIGTSYSAGFGLNLSNNEFSVASDSFLPCSGATCPQGEASRLYYDANTGGAYWIGRAGNELGTGTALGVGGDLSASGTLEVSDRTRLNDRVSINQSSGDDPDSMLHVRQDSFLRGLVLEAPPWSGVTHLWNLHSFDDFGDHAGSFQFRHRTDDGSFSVRARIDPDDGSYSQVSDARLKEEVRYLDGVLGDFLRLRPAQYRMVHQDRNSQPKLGLLAQEVAKLFPQLVQYDEREDIYTIGYAGFSVLAIQAIREQQDIIDTQRDRLDTLESQVSELEERLHRLETQH